MTAGNSNGKGARATVNAIVASHGASKEELIPILKDVDREVGYLSPDALDEVSQMLRVPKGQLYSVASFYQMLSVKPHGRHVIRFCESAPCHVVGGREVWLALQDELAIKEGETSPDGRWTLQTVSCLGICGVGPVMLVDDDIYGDITPDQIPEILARYQ